MTKTRDELEEMTKDELVAYAESMDVEAHQGWVKDDIVSAILKGQKATAKSDKQQEANKFESTKHHEANKAKIRAENLEKQKDVQAEDARLAENQEIANFKGFPVAGETRDQLLERIRKMRDESAKITEGVVETEGYRSEGMQKEFDAEQEAGKAAVAKAVEEQERMRALWQKQEAGEKNQAG